MVGEPFRLALVAEDMWGNPTDKADAALALEPSRPVRGLPSGVTIKTGEGPRVIENLVVDAPGDVELQVMAGDKEVARANPMRVVASAPLRRYWADLHGQSGETIGMGSAEAYFRYARDAAFVDMVGHQGNDFQITDAFWKKLNELTAEFDKPGKFVCLPGYEWSGNTGMGGDRNIFYRHEGRPIRRSSHILVEGQTSTEAIYTADKLFDFLKDEDCCVIAHVGGRYADLKYAHDGKTERTVEVHSTLGHVRMDPARRVREGLSRRRGLPQRRPQGPARRDAARRLDLRRDRRAVLLLHAGADARRAVRGAAPAQALRHHRHAHLHRSQGRRSTAR